MNLLRLFGVSSKLPSHQMQPPARGNASNVVERRREFRHDVEYPVLIRQHGAVPVRGCVINMSLSGAGIQVSRWTTQAGGNWTSQLQNGDEIWISGLLSEPVFCWVVEASDHLMRVHYSVNDAMRKELRAMTATIWRNEVQHA